MSGGRLARRLLFLILGCAAGLGAAEKSEKWVEVRSPSFVVVSNAGEREARRAAGDLEEIRAALKNFLPRARVDPGRPIFILAAKDENSLRSLLPEFWERKGQSQPAGLFQSGPDKHYLVLRTDIRSEDAYKLACHEYVHLLLSLNVGRMPLWLGEGLAEFYANTTVRAEDVWIGRPDKWHVWLLRDRPLLPLAELLAADRTSPYYNEADKTTIFYAQSWALTHYFMLAEARGEKNPVRDFLGLLSQDVEEKAATEQAFGSLPELEKGLRNYVRRYRFPMIRHKTVVEVSERTFPARVLPAAESAAIRGDFLAHRGRRAEARALLEEALSLDPNLAAAHESLGLLHLFAGEHDEAKKWFARAVALDSKSFLAHYYDATLNMLGALSEEEISRVEGGLQRTIELAPEFAPAYASLAAFYSMRNRKLARALSLVQEAVGREPGVVAYQISLAQITAQLGHVEAALKLGERVLAQAKTPSDREMAQTLLSELRKHQENLARAREEEERARLAEEERERARARKEQAEEDRLREAEAEAREAERILKAARTKSERRLPPPRKMQSARGRIGTVSCSAPAAMSLTLNLLEKTLKLRAPDRNRVRISFFDLKPPLRFDPCIDLKRARALVFYLEDPGSPDSGEVLAIELSK
jgi:tetratricopeptide (TPR) repeat protein